MNMLNRIKEKDLDQMVAFVDHLLNGDCDVCPAYDLCHDDWTFNECKPYLRKWLESKEETEDLLADDPIK